MKQASVSSADHRAAGRVGGGASLKESVVLPGLYELLRKLVAALNWHGALSMDVIVTTDGPVVIDVNPRLVEPMNAFFAPGMRSCNVLR